VIRDALKDVANRQNKTHDVGASKNGYWEVRQ
jgi:hypothetical protein